MTSSVLLALLMMCASGCTLNKRVTTDGILGTTWKLEQIDIGGKKVVVEDAAAPTATFNEDETGETRVSGSGGVNRYIAGYSTDGESISIDDIGSTRMSGPPDRLRIEAMFFEQLRRASAWKIDGNTLILITPDGRVYFKRLD